MILIEEIPREVNVRPHHILFDMKPLRGYVTSGRQGYRLDRRNADAAAARVKADWLR
ncbi:MAG: hypothetical protein AB9873_04095 [Syntrophobacteraceae bacterium]